MSLLYKISFNIIPCRYKTIIWNIKGPEITITNINDLKNQIINSSQIAFDLYFHYFVDLL